MLPHDADCTYTDTDPAAIANRISVMMSAYAAPDHKGKLYYRGTCQACRCFDRHHLLTAAELAYWETHATHRIDLYGLADHVPVEHHAAIRAAMPCNLACHNAVFSRHVRLDMASHGEDANLSAFMVACCVNTPHAEMGAVACLWAFFAYDEVAMLPLLLRGAKNEVAGHVMSSEDDGATWRVIASPFFCRDQGSIMDWFRRGFSKEPVLFGNGATKLRFYTAVQFTPILDECSRGYVLK